MMARVGAHVSGDKEMLELTALLLKANMRLLGSIATPELVCWGCATRAHPPEKPMFFVGSAWLREMKGATQIPEFLGKNAKANLVDPAHVCVRAARILRKMGDDFGGAGAEPAGPVSLKYPFTVWRGPDRHLAVMAKPEGLKGKPEEVADWVEAPWGIVKGNVKVQASLVRCGFGWSAPPPSPKAGAKAISHIKAGGSH
jgi:hypothetical protein